ncbi:MAG: alpha/beta fold hydrolase [Actinomycetales bacterium]|nr:alpha/beta fold hydrolase [Candidatus Phosphoribacter baldrii]
MSLRIHRVPVSYGANIMAQEILPDGPVAGGTPTVVLAHGWCLDHTSWHKVLADLQTRRDVRVVLYDQRGHGKSSMGEVGDPTVRILGDDLREVIDMVAPDGPLVLAGHSMGGMSIMAYAGMHYEHFTGRVKGTVLASTAASIEGRTPVPLERGHHGACLTRAGHPTPGLHPTDGRGAAHLRTGCQPRRRPARRRPDQAHQDADDRPVLLCHRRS